ncbi:MBL fold metallo-hydrolase [Streptomyces sp. NRRL S-1022]|uniref:MBL fold metallo-hydrolase n=1 Tax=Streptomyces sp. NRRL S-1022 TaxID=1463880 RepID=UPI000568C656|nr:MBL fold metallo-hydrolase [Streptomyces sp. NRRL S-1022]
MPGTKVIPLPVLGKRNVTAYLLLGRRPVVVDSGVPGSGRKVYEQVAEQGVDPDDISMIVVTHGHIDHFGGAAELSRLTGAPIAAHVGDLGQYTSGRVREPYLPTGSLGRLLATLPPFHVRAEPFTPQVLVRGEMPLADYGIDARIVPTPGHTAGSVSVLTEAGDLVAGDLIATPLLGLLPRLPWNPPFHDDPRANLASLRRMLDLGPERLHAGHGGMLDPGRVRRWVVKEQRRLERLEARGRLRLRMGDDVSGDA